MTSSLLITWLIAFCCSSLLAQNLPVGTILEARLSNATGSRISHRGDPVEATVIAPVYVKGRTLVPPGSKIFGSVSEVKRLGLGLKYATASLGYEFNSLRLSNGETVPVHLQLLQVETAKEHVDRDGIVRGIHPIVGLSSGLSFFTVPLSFLSPVVSVPVWGMKSVIAPSANPEIYFPQGTEVFLRLTVGANVPYSNVDVSRIAAFSPGEATQVQRSLSSLEQRRAYLGTRPSDWVNLVFIGSRKQMNRAFQSAGWTEAHGRSPVSLYCMYLALTKRKGYPKAPMNTLTLNGIPSDFVYQKSLDTVEKRHHVRLWKDPQRPDVWLGAAAEDVGFQFKLAHWTHSTDPNIDSERAKVINDLSFTGCLDTAGLLPRASSGGAPSNRAVHTAWTDGQIAVVQLNSCVHPAVMAGARFSSVPYQHGRPYRILRSFRDDLVRSNIFFMTYNTIRAVTKDRDKQRRITVTDADLRNLSWVNSLSAVHANASLAHTDSTQ